MKQETESQLIELIAMDRLEMPLSSIEQKLRRKKKQLAETIASKIGVENTFEGQRVSAKYSIENKERARGTKEACKIFCEKYPKYGEILTNLIEEKRIFAEEHLYFQMNPGCKISSEEYFGIICSLGITESKARALYPILMEISRKLARMRDEERSVIVGKYTQD